MAYKKKGDYAPHIPPSKAPPCHIPGCVEPGAYKAPRSREELHDYRWFCLTHIREHNQQWDYFSGMDAGEIESFIKDAVTGHRPTWDREGRASRQYEKLQDALYEFLNTQKPAKKASPPVAAKVRRALALFEMEYPYTLADLKLKYRRLVKKFHPDVNREDPDAEEKFKKITTAYHSLSEHVKNA